MGVLYWGFGSCIWSKVTNNSVLKLVPKHHCHLTDAILKLSSSSLLHFPLYCFLMRKSFIFAQSIHILKHAFLIESVTFLDYRWVCLNTELKLKTQANKINTRITKEKIAILKHKENKQAKTLKKNSNPQ